MGKQIGGRKANPGTVWTAVWRDYRTSRAERLAAAKTATATSECH